MTRSTSLTECSAKHEQATSACGAGARCSKSNRRYPYADLVDGAFKTLLILEDEASVLSTHQPNLVPGLLQTYRYGWELMTTLGDLSLEEVERRVRLRTARQRVLTRYRAPRLAVVLDEAALRRPVGSWRRDARAVRAPGRRGLDADDDVCRCCPSMPGRTVRWASRSTFSSSTATTPRVMQLEFLDREHFADEAEEVKRYAEAYDEASRQALDPGELADLPA